MSYNIDFSIAASEQVETALCKRVESIRLSRNMTQVQIADEAGVSIRTIGRMEKGQGVSLDTFIRVLSALGIQQNLETVLPDPGIRPAERISNRGNERRRARPKQSANKSTVWLWGDEK